MLAFVISLDDVVITEFVKSSGQDTLPTYMLGQLRRVVTPEINAISIGVSGPVRRDRYSVLFSDQVEEITKPKGDYDYEKTGNSDQRRCAGACRACPGRGRAEIFSTGAITPALT